MRHGDSSHLRHGGDLAPLSNAAGMGNIDIQDIDGTSPHQCFTAVFGDLALAGSDWDPRALAHAPHAGELVIPVAGLLQPADLIGFDEATEARGLLWGPGLIGITGDHKALTDGLSDLMHTLGILVHIDAPHLHLDARKALVAIAYHLGDQAIDALIIFVIAANHNGWQPVMVVPEQCIHR